MASGYEKADCGVDPNEGWGNRDARPPFAGALSFAIWLALMAGWVAASPTVAALRQILNF